MTSKVIFAITVGQHCIEEVLVRASETRMIWQRKCKWLGHFLRYEGFRHDIEGEMMGKSTSGRKRKELLYNIMEGSKMDRE